MFDEKFLAQFDEIIGDVMMRAANKAAVFLSSATEQRLKSDIKFVFSKSEAAEKLCVTVSTVERLIKDRRLGCFKNQPSNGRVTIGLHHILGYLRSIEYKSTNRRGDFDFDKFYGFKSASDFEITDKAVRLVPQPTDAKKNRSA